MSGRIRVLVAKAGLDGHDRGAKVVALALKHAGFEVIYSGLHRTVEQIAETALQEDVQVLGVSILSGAHLPIAENLIDQLKERGARPLILFGGNIPANDTETLREYGVDEVFATGASLEGIVAFIKSRVQPASPKDMRSA